MVNLTIKDLFHKKGKFILIVLGLSFSIFLVQYSAGMWNGVLSKSSEVVDAYGFDVWIQEEKQETIGSGILDDSVYLEVKTMDHVKDCERLIYNYAELETKDYTLGTLLIGYELDGGNLEPWDVIEGDTEDLAKTNAIIVDKHVLKYLTELRVGSKVVIGREEMEIVGICENAKFMSQPYVWASLETARKIALWAGNWCSSIGVKLTNDYSVDEFKEDVEQKHDTKELPKLEVMSTEEIRQNTYEYIVNEGGMGGSLYIIVAMGFFVTLIIVSITIYQNINEKIPEFGTLKAIGAEKGYLNRMLLGQVGIMVSLSFAIGTILAIVFGIAMESVSIVPVSVSIPVSFILYGVTILLALACAMVSIRKVHKIDPAIVFRT